ncbi:MAG TPA: TonB-dependent receptor [Rubrivivax sp.]|nr:TonB-dependent receptor [Rubrivivax sp.]
MRRAAVPLALAASAGAVMAQPAPSHAEPVVISGSGVERRAFETPYAVSIVDAEELRSAGPMVNLSESLNRVPGIVANLRNNYAQDLQISSRGFGARATFGIRGLRLYTDGIPATMPDGQGQVSHFDIAGAQRIEVLRGPFSALYGANSGGVISLVSAAPKANTYALDGDVGSDGLWQARAGVEALFDGGWNLRVQASEFNTDGVRPHSAAQRTLGNARIGWVGERDSVTLLINSVNQPAQDPLGLTRAQFDQDPFQTTPQALLFDTRKTTGQTQGGGTWRHRFDDAGALQESVLTLYAGQRDVTQWQAIPPAAQANPRHPGGVVSFARDYAGVDARLRWRWERVGLIAGVASEQQKEQRRGYQNFIGSGANQVLGVTGALRRDEDNRVRSTDAYLQGEVELTPTLWASAGLRSGRLTVRSSDHDLANGDDSDDTDYGYTTPVLALQWLPAPQWNLYASAAQGFESPTLNELAYRPDGSSGFNTTLQPQTSTQFELGAKWREDSLGLALEAALFRADTEDEIGVLTNAGGRSSFQNVGRTRRSGAELALQWQPLAQWRTQFALTTLDAKYRDSFQTCAAVPCTQPSDRVTVPAGNRIAGTMARSAFASLAWLPLPATEVGLELRYQGEMPVNDRNTDFSPSATLVGLRFSHSLPLGPGTLSLLARLDNLTDKVYAGAVIVNEGNGRYFETAAGRNAMLALRWQAPF